MTIKILLRLTLILCALSLAACGSQPLVEEATATAPANATSAQSPTAVPSATAALAPTSTAAAPSASAAEPSALARVAGSYQFAEGPATDAHGDVYFSDITAGKIYKWTPDGSVSVFVDGLSMPNGLAFAADGLLIACEGGKGRLVAIDPQGQITVLAEQYNGVRFNEPNDLWIDPQGGVYFTDPAYQSPVVQDGEDVYYLAPDRSQVSRVIDDLVRPNGIVGTADGKTLYVADHGAGQTFAYDINPDGTLSNQRLFVASGSDGMTLDTAGNLYLTTPNQVAVYDASGNHLQDIPTPENPTNVTLAGQNGLTLFITARTAVYTIQMPAASVGAASSFILSSPEVAEGGTLPIEYTCDGASSTLALNWSGAPAGTQSYAVIMHHIAGPDDIHWYWVLYDIPVSVTSLPKNMVGVGILGNNSVNGKAAYAPPCSKGPGPKTYTYTVYALSAEPQLSVPPAEVSQAVLLEAIQNITLASAELHVTYTRK
jgi:gluconolactonase